MKKFRELSEQHREEGRHKIIYPKNKAIVSPRPESDSANVKLREQDDTMEKKEMASTQAHFIKYAAEEILEYIEMGGQIEEWYQNKLSKVHSDMEGLHSWMEGEKRRTGMVDEATSAYGRINARFKSLSGRSLGDAAKEHADEVKRLQKEIEAHQAEMDRRKEAMKKEEVEELDEAMSNDDKSSIALRALVAKKNLKQSGNKVKSVDFLKKMKDRVKAGEDLKKEEIAESTPTKQQVKQAIGIARDKRYAKGNVTGAVSAMDKLNKGLGQHPVVKKELQKQNEEVAKNSPLNKAIKQVRDLDEENKPTNPELWSRAKALAKSKFDVYPSAYANGWAAKWYKEKGGGWKSVNEENYEVTVMHTTKDGDKGEHTHKVMNADDARHAKNIALQKHEKMLNSRGVEVRGMGTTTAKMVEAKKDDLPFTPDEPKKQAVAGKYGVGYSTARHLARMAMQKQVEKMKKKPIKEEDDAFTDAQKTISRKAKIIKDIVKKNNDSDDKFQANPELKTHINKV
jgi:hypothetical protein